MTTIYRLAESLNINERELLELITGTARVLIERFRKPLLEGMITMPQAIKFALEKYVELQREAAIQILTNKTNGVKNIKILQDLLLDQIYDSLNKN